GHRRRGAAVLLCDQLGTLISSDGVSPRKRENTKKPQDLFRDFVVSWRAPRTCCLQSLTGIGRGSRCTIRAKTLTLHPVRAALLAAGILWVGVAGGVCDQTVLAQAPRPAARAPSHSPSPAKPPSPVASHAAAAPAQDHNAVIRRYCVGCHNEKT